MPSASNGVKVEMTAEMEAAVVLGTHPSAWLRASGTCACHASTQRLLVSAAAEGVLSARSADERGEVGDADVSAGTMRRARRGRQRRRGLCGRLARATAAAATAVAERPSLLDAVVHTVHRVRVRVDGRRRRRRRVQVSPGPAARSRWRRRGRRSRCCSTCTPPGRSPGGEWGNEGRRGRCVAGDAQAAAAAASRHRLAGLATRILRDFARLASGEGGGCVVAQARDEINAGAPLAVDALKALARFSDDLFAEKVGRAFPALTALVRCEHAPGGGEQGARGGFHREDRSARDRFVG